MSMPKITVLSGLSMILIGLVGSLVAMSMVDKWWYAAIPVLIGVLLVICGWAAPMGKAARVVSMHLAPLIALLGVVGSFMPSGLNFSQPGSVAFVSSIFRLLMILVGLAYVSLCVRSFLAARKTKAS